MIANRGLIYHIFILLSIVSLKSLLFKLKFIEHLSENEKYNIFIRFNFFLAQIKSQSYYLLLFTKLTK